MRVCDWQKLGISALLCLLLKDSILGWKEFGHSLKSVHWHCQVESPGARVDLSQAILFRVCSSSLQPGAGLRGELHISKPWTLLGGRVLTTVLLYPSAGDSYHVHRYR